MTEKDITSCWKAMSILRPMLKEDEFIKEIETLMKEGYTLLFIKDNGAVVSIAGYRFITMLYSGKMLYIDDLSTLETCRGKGYASALLNHIYKIAKDLGCKSIHLDSGHTRYNAHKLYFKENFTIRAFHFMKQI